MRVNLATSTGKVTANTLVKTGRSALSGVQIVTNGTANATVIVYDNTSAAGKIIFEQTVIGANQYGGRDYAHPVEVENGLYATIAGTGASMVIDRIKGRYL